MRTITKNSKFLSLLLVIVMLIGMIPTTAFASTDLTVNGNVIDITDKVIYSKMSGRWHATVSSLTIDGATVESATEDGTTINVMLADDTDPYGEVSAKFGWTLGTFGSGSQDVTTVELADGKATLTVVVTGKVSNASGTATYTINFESEAKATEPPAVTGETEFTEETYTTIALDIPVSEYFGKAAAYYLVDNETYTEIEETYTTSWDEPGTYTLVFAAGNSVGYSENVTVTVTVKEIPKYDVLVETPEGYNLTFYAVTGIEDGKAVLGKELAYDAETGTVTVPENISRIAWTADDAIGMSAAVADGDVLKIQKLNFNAKTAAGETDSEAAITVADAEGYTVSGTVADSFLIAADSGYTYTATPGSSNSGSWNTATLSDQTVSKDTDEVTVSFTLKSGKSITVPDAAKVTVYYQSQYFKADEVKPAYSVENEDDTTTYYYACTSSSTYCKGYVYKAILNEDSIVKAGYLHSVKDVTLDWDGSESPDFRGNTNVPNYTYSGSNIYRSGDGVILNVNSTGHVVLDSDGSREIGAFRVWEIIDSDTTNVMIEPEFNYTRTAGDDVYSLSDIEGATAYGNNWQKLTATGSGTAFLEISYDALHIVNGYEAGAWGGAYGHLSDYVYNASNPVQNGMLIVQTDGNAATDVSFGIASDRISWTWDAELDTYYFMEDTGSLNLTPTATSGIQSVAVSNDKGNSWKTLKADEEGVYTADIVSGNNIIRVINGNGQTAYQVVRGAKLDVTVTNLTDTDAGSSYKTGDKVRLVFDGLIAPVYKMSGIYNPASISVKYTGTDSVAYTTNGTSYYVNVPYSYKGNDTYYTSIDVTIPEDVDSLSEDNTYVLSNGYMSVGGYAGVGSEHRSKLTYNGVAQNTSASMKTSTRSVFDDIVLTPEIATYSVTLNEGEGYTIEAAEGSESPVNTGDSYSFKVTVADGYDATNMSVKVNEEVIEADEDGIYTIESVMTDITVTVEGLTKSNRLPVMIGEDIVIEDIRLGEWHDVDLTTYFEDPDGDELTYYVLADGATEWTKLSDSTYRYYPANTGEQTVAVIALDGSVALEDAVSDENTAVLKLTALVAERANEATVTLSVTQGSDKFYTSEKNIVMSPQEITVPYFDLALYGLEDYYYNPQCYDSWNGTIGSGTAGTQESADGVVTTLHAFIWATEVYQLGYDEADAGQGKSYDEATGKIAGGLISVSGNAGSSFLNLWNGTNMNYYLNMEYPLGCPKVGSTSDQQALFDGDVISVHIIEDATVMGSAYSALVVDDNSEYEYDADATEATVECGETITLTAYRTESDWENYITNHVAYTDAMVVYNSELTADTAKWMELGNTDEDGQIVIDTSNMNSGTYYIAVQGAVDHDASQERGISVFTLIVKEKPHEHAYGEEWKYDENQHWNECTCGEKENVADHDFEWVVDNEAEEFEAGTKHEECTVCHVKRNENTEIPPIHDYAKVLAEAKEAAKKEVAEYKDAADYREAEAADLAAVIEKANAAIDAAETIDEVTVAVDAAKAEMDVIKTDADLTAEEELVKDEESNTDEESKVEDSDVKEEQNNQDEQGTEDNKQNDADDEESAEEPEKSEEPEDSKEPEAADETDEEANVEADSDAEIETESTTPETGDSANLLLWLVIAALAGTATVTGIKKKEN